MAAGTTSAAPGPEGSAGSEAQDRATIGARGTGDGGHRITAATPVRQARSGRLAARVRGGQTNAGGRAGR
jgi:hypothetical protein